MNRMLRHFLAVSSIALPFALGCAAGQQVQSTGSGAGDTGGGGNGAGAGGGASACTPGQQIACACPGGTNGVQACNAEGSGFEKCACGGGGSGGTGGGPIGCGDGFCAGSEEDCHSCPQDCGPCAPCTIAPSCDNAQIPPAAMTHVPELNTFLHPVSKEELLARFNALVAAQGPGVRLIGAALREPRAAEPALVAAVREALEKQPKLRDALARHLGAAGLVPAASLDLSDLEAPLLTPRGNEFPGGTIECGAPLLRIRAAKVTVHEEDDDFANDIVYCALTSEAKTASEIRITPKTPNLDEGDSFTYPIEAGIFWGQMAPETPGGNLLLTYDCFEADSTDGYTQLIDAVGDAATQIGGVAGSYGWVFTVIGAVAPVLSGAIGLDGDDHLFNAQQTIPLDKQLDLTNGRFWTVRRSGTHLNSDWDWELRVEAWGCAEFGTL